MKGLRARFDMQPVVRLSYLVGIYNKKYEDNFQVFIGYGTFAHVVEGDAKSVMSFIGFLSDSGEDSLISVEQFKG